MKAWKSGDKKKAQELAKKGLEESEKLTQQQAKELPNSIEISYNLQVMSEGQGTSQ